MSSTSRGFTLVETVASLGVMAVLLTAIASILVVTTRAIPTNTADGERARATADAMAQLESELTYATSITERTARSITFTVADRGHDAAGPETIRYSWSGVPGDAVMREYNGAAPAEWVGDVHHFTVRADWKAQQTTTPPRVLLVVNSSLVLTTQENARRSLFTGWGMTATAVSASASAATLRPLVAASDVVYICQGAYSAGLVSRLGPPTCGVVYEEPQYLSEGGLSTSWSTRNNTQVSFAATSHEITAGFPAGAWTLFSSNQPMAASGGSIAPGGTTLITDRGGTAPMLIVVEAGATLTTGTAAGRRVKLPWGTTGLNLQMLNDDGVLLMRRAVTWAAAPVVNTTAGVAIQVGADSADRVTLDIPLRNTPRR